MKKPDVWSYDGSVLATGVDTVDELAQLIADEGGYTIRHLLGLPSPEGDDELPVAQVLEALAERKVHGYLIPGPHFRQEYWDAAQMFECALDAKPGRGYVKVVLVNYLESLVSS